MYSKFGNLYIVKASYKGIEETHTFCLLYLNVQQIVCRQLGKVNIEEFLIRVVILILTEYWLFELCNFQLPVIDLVSAVYIK